MPACGREKSAAAGRTLVHAAVTFAGPVPAALVRPAVRPLATRILRQDAWILGQQQDNIARFGGERHTSSVLDVLGPEIDALLTRLAEADTTATAPAPAPARPERTLTLYV